MGNGICFDTLNGAQYIFQQFCTPAICSVPDCGQIKYIPTIGGNATYLAIFVLLLIAQLFLCIRYKTWGFLVGMFGGLTLEVLGYGGRVWLHDNIFNFNAFLLYLICLTIAPAFLSGSIYICLGRIVTINGNHLSRFSPKTYAIVFVSCDILSLVLQAAGGALAAQANTQSQENAGVDIMIAGLAYQVFSLLLFLVLWADFAMRARKATEDQKTSEYADLRASALFRFFQYALLIATVLILIRSIYRVTELQGGFGGTIANNQASFMVFEGPMIILAVLGLTIFHPGLILKEVWRTSEFSFSSKKTPHVEHYNMQAGKDDHSSRSELRPSM
ncbi:MAG: hypothetical protein M1821_005834 [Bathelium mastoideum]|nr:MAG: hypothetical protein M1821_005834 [Bathelium mastoideum]